MAFRIEDFRTQLQGDGARPNLFEVRFGPLPGVGSPDATRKLSFMCKAAELPGSTVASVTVPYFGRQIKVAGNRTYPDWTVTVINDENFVVRDAMELWLAAINDPVRNVRSPNAKSSLTYGINASVLQYGKALPPTVTDTDNVPAIKTYTFIGMFPTEVSPISLGWDQNDSVEEFTVTFSYQYWTASYGAESTGLTTPSPLQVSG